MAAPSVLEGLPPPLDSTSQPPPLFDGTTRLYVSHDCPFAQRTRIVRNYKGLHDKIKLVAIDLHNRPAWYKEKVYPGNKVPALEHNGKVIGESLDLVKYIDANFEGPSLLPEDPDKKRFAEELLAYSDTFTKNVYTSFKGDPIKQAGAEFDYLENALHKFDDGPLFLGGQFSQVDAVYAPFVERFHIFFKEQWNYDITSGRPKLAAFIEEVDKLDAYKQTKCYPNYLVQVSVKEVLPPTLDSTADPPPIFDGTIRLYVNYECPFCQRVWIVRNYKGLQEKIKLVAIHLIDKPAWYKEKLYSENKVPALEHNGKVIGESMDLVKYVDANFEGPTLLPEDPAKLKFAEEMLAYLDTFLKNVFASLKGDPVQESAGEFDYLEKSLQKFDGGPFFLGQLSQVDAAFVPFIERFHIFLLEVFNYDITSGRPKLAAYLEEMNKIDAYKHTKCDPKWLVQLYKTRYMASS